MRQILIFKQDGCPPCKHILPFCNKIGSYYQTSPKVPNQNKIVTSIVDIHDPKYMALTASYGVNSTPTVLGLVNNQLVGRITGANEEKIEDLYYKTSTL